MTLDPLFQATNILLHIEDETVLIDGEEAEIKDPSARKITEKSVTFETRDLRGRIHIQNTSNQLPIERPRFSCTSCGAHPWMSGILAAWFVV